MLADAGSALSRAILLSRVPLHYWRVTAHLRYPDEWQGPTKGLGQYY
jgi:hypothetical protein